MSPVNESPPQWLPALVLFDGDWHTYLISIYEIFQKDFVRSRPVIPNKRFALKRHPLVQGKEATFWHLISEGQVESDRTPDIRRCERIGWPRPLINVAASSQVKCWKNRRNGENRVIIALEDFSYLVVLADRGEYVLLWTAYTVDREHTRKKLRREYETAIKS